VVILTDGRHAFSKVLGITSNPTPEELKQIRKSEAKKAIKKLGVPEEDIIFLDFEDGALQKHENEAKEKILAIINRYSPIEIYFPYSKDYNIDHKTTNHIIKGCIKESKSSPKIFQYSIVQKYARIGPLIDKLTNIIKRHIAEIDVSDFITLKREAIEQYESQISIISERQTKPVLSQEIIKKHLRDKELFYIK